MSRGPIFYCCMEVGMGVTIAFTTDGRARAFMASLDGNDRTRIEGLLAALAQTGRITNPTKFKRLHTGLWELKAKAVRLLGDYRPGGQFVIAHGILKRRQTLDQAEVRLAERNLAAHDRMAA